MSGGAVDRVARWTPWVIGAAAAIAYAVLAPRGGGTDVPVWGVLARLASAIPIGEVADRVHALGAVCAAAAAVLLARLAIGYGGGDAASIAGGVAGAAVLAGTVVLAGAAAHPAAGATASAGAVALAAALVLGAIALADRVVAGGGSWPGVSIGVAVGLAVAMDRSALALVPVVVALLALRLGHGARWPLIAPLAGGVAWLVAMIPIWRAGAAPATIAAPSPIELADAIGAIAAVAAAAGVISLLARRRTRWSAGLVVSLVAGSFLLERLGFHHLRVLPIAGLALAAGAGVGRLARLVDRPLGQTCVGLAAAVIVALPAAL